MKNKVLSGFKNFDIFGQKLSLKINGKNSVKSHIGGVLSVATYIIVIIIVVVEMIAVFTKS